VFGGLLGPSPLSPGMANQLPQGFDDQARKQAIQQMAIAAMSAPRGQQLAQATQAGQTGYRSSLVDMLRMQEMERMQADKKAEKDRQAALAASPQLRGMLGDLGPLLSPDTQEKVLAELMTSQPTQSSTDDIKEYLYAVQSGTFNGSLLDWILAQKKAGASTTNVNLPPESDAFRKALGEGSATQFDKLFTSANSARETLSTIQALKPLAENPNFITGIGSDYILGVGRLLGIDGVEETQAYFAGMGQIVAERIKAFGSGTGLSDKDREFAEKIAGASNTIEKNSILRIIKLNEESAKRVIDAYNERRSFLTQNNPTVPQYYPEIFAPGPWNKYAPNK